MHSEDIRRMKSNFSEDEEEEEEEENEDKQIETDFQSFSHRKSTQERPPKNAEAIDELSKNFGQELINKSDDIAVAEISK